MTPQLKQAVRVLQLSALDLVTEIRAQIDSNPLLEELDQDGERDDSAVEPTGIDRADDFGLAPSTADDIGADEGLRADVVGGDKLLDTDYDALFDPPTAPISSANAQGDGVDMFDRGAAHHDLRQHVMNQLPTVSLSERDQRIAEHIVDSMDDRGYLTVSLAEVAESSTAALVAAFNDNDERGSDDPPPPVETEEAEAVLKVVQNLEPDGIGARDLCECLSIQLRAARHRCADAELAHTLIQSSIEAVAARDYARMTKQTKASRADLERAITIITALNPTPGTAIADAASEYVVPDLIVRQNGGRWQVRLNSESLPRVALNRRYAALAGNVRGADKQTNTFIKQHLNDAKWFLRSLDSRHDTLLRVGREIVKRQYAFFESGESAMKPMILTDIAAELDLHESTVSRATTQKYMQTPFGVFELKYFFSSAVAADDGGSHSSTAIRAVIKEIVDTEAPTKPMSDNKIAGLLSDRGINVARRTVAKYREALKIPSSSQRKRLS